MWPLQVAWASSPRGGYVPKVSVQNGGERLEDRDRDRQTDSETERGEAQRTSQKLHPFYVLASEIRESLLSCSIHSNLVNKPDLH